MKKLLLAILLLPGLAFADASGTFTEDANGESVLLPYGSGTVKLVGTFGSGTVTVETLRLDGVTWDAAKTYTAQPDPNPEVMNFGGTYLFVRVTMTGSTGPSLYWEIKAAPYR